MVVHFSYVSNFKLHKDLNIDLIELKLINTTFLTRMIDFMEVGSHCSCKHCHLTVFNSRYWQNNARYLQKTCSCITCRGPKLVPKIATTHTKMGDALKGLSLVTYTYFLLFQPWTYVPIWLVRNFRTCISFWNLI